MSSIMVVLPEPLSPMSRLTPSENVILYPSSDLNFWNMPCMYSGFFSNRASGMDNVVIMSNNYMIYYNINYSRVDLTSGILVTLYCS